MGLKEWFGEVESNLPAGTRVLIVEDQLLAAATISDMIESLGGIPVVAYTVEEGLAACSRGEFDIALLDLDLHGRSGAPIAAALASLNKPFLIMTGKARRLPGFEEVRVLAKPYPLTNLAHELTTALAA